MLEKHSGFKLVSGAAQAAGQLDWSGDGKAAGLRYNGSAGVDDLRLAADASKPAPAAGADPFAYFVQAGAFRTPADAEAQRAKLAMLGFDAKVSEREQAGQTVYRVRTGPHRAKADADATQAKLAGNGIDAALVRVQR